MVRRNEYVDYLLELMSALGGVSAKGMFGGFGIYKDGRMFGLVANDILYLKADQENRDEFTSLGLAPFVFESKAGGKQISMSYYQCPDDALESAALMADWARSGYAAALRVQADKTKKKSVKQKSNKSV